MADVKISELTAVSAVEANDLLEVSEDTGGGTYASKKATAAQVRDFALSTAADQNSYMAAALTKPDIRPSLNLDFARVKALDPRITFTRASEGRYYDGKTTAKAEENLLLRSQDYSATWTVTNLTPVTGKTAPDTTSTATEFTAGAANATLTQSVTALAADYTFSVWLRRVTGTGDIDITAHSGGTWVTQAISGTWARYTVTQTLTAGARTPGIRVVTSGDVIEVWGAQLEQRSAATAYTATTTQPITNYVPQLLTAASGVARFDHDPITCESLGLLIEEQRTNLLLRSEDFSTSWNNTNSTEQVNTIISPIGTLSGTKLIVDSGQATGQIRQSITKAASAITYTLSIYAKVAEFNRISLQCEEFGNTANRASVSFSLLDGSVTTAAAAFGTFTAASAASNAVGNGWYKFSLTFTSGTETSMQARITASDSAATGDGYSGIYIWGAQLEAGAFPTSYIPTTASQVTRSADAASMTGTNFSSWYRQDEGTMYASFNRASVSTAAFPAIVSIESGGDNRWGLLLTNDDKMTGTIRTNGTFYADLRNGVYLSNAPNAFAMSLSATSASTTANGSTPISDTSLIIPAVNNLKIGNVGNAAYLNGHIRKLAYYPKRLTDAQLQALTK